MAIKINEATEISIPIKTLVAIVFALLSASWYVFTTQEKIHDLQSEIKLLRQDLEFFKHQPSRANTEIELMKKDIDYLRQKANKEKS
jgi:hypothetical protein